MLKDKRQIAKEVVRLVLELQRLRKIRNGLPIGPSRTKVKKEMSDIYQKLKEKYALHLPKAIKRNLGIIKPRRATAKKV